jgi:hypothetical protein
MQNHLNKKKPRKQATNRGACINELDRVPTSLEGGPTTRRKSDGMPNLTVRVGWRFRSSQPFTQILKLIMLLNIYFLGVGKRWSKTEVPPEIGEIKERHEKGPASSWKVGVSAFESGTCFRAAVRLQLCLSADGMGQSGHMEEHFTLSGTQDGHLGHGLGSRSNGTIIG